MAEKKFLVNRAKALIVLGVIGMAVAGAIYDMYFGTPPLREDDQSLSIDTQQWPMAPDFSFTDLNGGEHKLQDFKGKIVLIDFWATWCPTCLIEFPGIVKFVNDHDGDVILIALSSDSGVEPIKEFIKKQTPDMQSALQKPFVYVALDKNRNITRDTFLTEMYPETIFIAPDLHMVKKSVGTTQWDKPEMKSFFEALKKISVR